MGFESDFGALEPEHPPQMERRADDRKIEVLRDYVKKNLERTDELIQRAGHRDAELEDLRKRLEAIAASMKEVLDLLSALKGALRFFGWMAALAKWGTTIAAALSTIGGLIYAAYYMATHGGRPPGT